MQTILTLNDGHTMPQLGFGVFKVPQKEAAETVMLALKAGYRSIDTAAIYGNEEGVGIALAERADDGVALTTKLWNDKHEPGAARAALTESLRKLGRPSVELYLIHWPVQRSDFVATWKAMIGFREAGRAPSELQIAVALAETRAGVGPELSRLGVDELVLVAAPPAEPEQAEGWITTLKRGL